MSTRGRGRGGGVVKPTDRSSSSSSAASSRNSSLTRPSAIEDDPRFKQYTSKAGAATLTTPNLGASSRSTPKFTPNLSALKNKDKDKTDTSVSLPSSNSNNDPSTQNRKDFSNGNRSQQFRGGQNNHRGSHSRGNFMQMEGIFQGNAQIPVTSSSSSSSRFSSTKREPSASNLRIPNIKKLGTSKTVLIGDVDGLKYEIDEEYEPRQIPLAERKSIFDTKKESNITHKFKEPISTNKNSDHLNSFIQLFSQQKLESTSKSVVKDEPIEQTDLPKPEDPTPDPSQLILMQFPDVLPCPRTTSSSASTTTTNAKPELATLSDLPDGFLGKLQIFKSGKCRLKLSDDTYLDVDIGQPTSFLQNVMVTDMASSSSTNPTNEQGTNEMNKLVCLGDIKHKLIVSLDVDHVLQDTRQ